MVVPDALLLPSLVGLLLAGPLLVRLMVGETYRETTLSLLPLLATAIFVNCLMIYPTYACKLTSRTDIWFFTIVVTAVSNVLLNVILIPRYQALGAVLSTLAAYSVGLVLLIANARRLFPLPFPEPIIVLAAALGTLFMAAWLWPFHQVTHWSALFYVIPGAMIIYAGVYAIVVTTGRTGLSRVFPMN